MTTQRERCDENNVLILEKNYKPYRYVCPGCFKKTGEPHPQKWIDIVRCKPCSTPMAKLNSGY